VSDCGALDQISCVHQQEKHPQITSFHEKKFEEEIFSFHKIKSIVQNT
jgi:hypothetical protein